MATKKPPWCSGVVSLIQGFSSLSDVLETKILLPYEPCHEKTNVLVSDLVQHKPGCTAKKDGLRLEISDLGSREIELSV